MPGMPFPSIPSSCVRPLPGFRAFGADQKVGSEGKDRRGLGVLVTDFYCPPGLASSFIESYLREIVKSVFPYKTRY